VLFSLLVSSRGEEFGAGGGGVDGGSAEEGGDGGGEEDDAGDPPRDVHLDAVKTHVSMLFSLPEESLQ
jgi:hypothetical protein